MELLVVTGLSGAGKSLAVNALEDIGYFCIDNIPAGLMPRLLDFALQGETMLDKVAVVVDIRGCRTRSDVQEALTSMDSRQVPYRVLFLDASDDVLARRYKETRRIHPLCVQEGVSMTDAIEQERKILQPFFERADFVVDTSLLSAAQNKERICKLFLHQNQQPMVLTILSFGFKYGLPKEADVVFDVRCLPNPFYIPELKEKTGLDSDVVDYVMKFEQSQELLHRILDLLDYSLPLYIKEGKSQLTIAVGCTGGKHRSITFARKIAEHCQNLGYGPILYHRDQKRVL